MAAEKPAVRITQQFREAKNMTYELDCSGSKLIVRIFQVEADVGEAWRVEARTSTSEDAVVASATAASREAAFEGVVQWWRANVTAQLDWAAIAQAMTAVRAI